MKEIKKTIKKTVGIELSLMEFMENQNCFYCFDYYSTGQQELPFGIVFVEDEILNALTPEVIKILKDTKIKLMMNEEDI